MKTSDKQTYRIGAVYSLGAKQPVERSFIETKLVEFAGMTAKQAHLLAGHWMGTLQFRAIRQAA